ncbi:unnamed protein product [Staurois parvus]|uniref:Uncharacterized protein n=1 Tax=Staurois parvus TaxID=386267 RepID=A0ABN9FLQ8_9NEOB|nr:unnamed protein product [Staurois parvus]
MLSLGALLQVFFSLESACYQHMANQGCPYRGSGVMQPHRTIRGE